MSIEKAGSHLSKLKTSRYLYILDAGHGGLDENLKYTTPGKRAYYKNGELMSFDLSVEYREENCDFAYYEGVGNRNLVKKIGIELDKLGIRYEFTVDPDEEFDVPLKARTDFANNLPLPTAEKKFISIHSDGVENPKAHGWSVYTSLGYTMSDPMGLIFYEEWAKIFPGERLRKGKKGVDKEKNLHITRETAMPAILLENFFHTNPRECLEILATKEGQNKIVSYIVNAIKRIEKEGL